MNKSGPIIVIEDDDDDQLLLDLAFKKLQHPNKVIYFSDGEAALEYLNQMNDVPFLILSDINMPKLDGFALRNKIHTDSQLSLKCIPYLFFSTAVDQQRIIDAYSLSVQGFFIKENSLTALEETLSLIIEYWKRCAAPNNF
ncbi:response regulator [Larkinella soli]|uniref:response regulator n=1 Tax=Larkinella soli TaxID=1770527 RepID=UPI000FFB291C|nr:response regulator [Larkinella soli]